MREDGVTLTELLIAFSIAGILVVALGFSFQRMDGKLQDRKSGKRTVF